MESDPNRCAMGEFTAVANVAEVPDPGSLLVELDDRLLVIVRVAGEVYALDDVCTHDGGPLSDGQVDPAGLTIACPRHGAKFSLRDGAAVTMPATKATASHAAKIEGEQILVRLAEG